MSERVTFAECLVVAISTQDFVAQFDRIHGSNLLRRGSPLDLAIDDSTGRYDADAAAFEAFVREYVWDRLPADVREDL